MSSRLLRRLALVQLLLFLASCFFFLPLPKVQAQELKPGVLVLAHGANDPKWFTPVWELVYGLQEHLPWPVELGFLEAINPDIPEAVAKLNHQGVNRIIAVPFFISTYSNHIEEIKYILGLRKDLPDPEEKLERAEPAGEVILTRALDDHPLFASLLTRLATSLVQNPEQEVVVLAAHGSDSEEGQEGWRQNLASLGEQMKASSGGKIKEVLYGFIFEGASPSLEETVSRVIYEKKKTALVVPVMISEGYFTGVKVPGILKKFPQDKYRYPGIGQRALLTADKEMARLILEWRAANEIQPAPQIGEVKLNLDQAYAFAKKWPCSALAWRVAGIAYPRLLGDQMTRESWQVVSFLPPEAGSRPVFEAVAEKIYYLGSWAEILPPSPTFLITDRATGKTTLVHARPELFGGEDFFALRNKVVGGRASPAEQALLQKRLVLLLENLLTQPDEAFAVRQLDPLRVRKGQELLSFRYPELAWEEGKLCLCRTFLYRGLQEAFAALWKEGVPDQGSFTVETKIGTPCAAEFLGQLAGEGRYRQMGPQRPPLPEDFYLQVRDGQGRSVAVKLAKGTIPPEFFALRDKIKQGKATQGELVHFNNLRSAAILRLLTDPKTLQVEKFVPPAAEFRDLVGHWAEGAVAELAAKGLVSGYPDGTFKPDKPVTRAELASLLSRALNLAPGEEKHLELFADRNELPSWSRGAVAACVREALLQGYPAGELRVFCPDRQVPRVELAVVLNRVARSKGLTATSASLSFKDLRDIPSWAVVDVQQASQIGLVAGYPDGTFKPDKPVTRAEAAAMVLRLLEKLPATVQK
ncbi:S-layer homology domain-containing protein [Desulfothermobacter acidiphilus]|uniref:S-layer homology domain-containing protein n=1 Tax=Desulfothermobacter acidiphilus TaxID=1938353 RepID=UPI003F8C267E